MVQLATDMFDARWWPLAEAVLLIWGLFGLVVVMLGGGRGTWLRPAAWSGVGLLALSVILSMLFEDLVPRWGALRPEQRGTYAAGLAMILAGVATLVVGGAVWSRRMLVRLSGAHPEPVRATRWLGLMAAGMATIVLGASLTHDDRFPVPWFWAIFGI